MRCTVQVRLIRSYDFEAAHRLPNVPPGHKCARIHGHSYGIEVVLSGPVDPERGWCLDFGDIDQVWEPLYQAFDHHYLNDIPGLENPTSENLARYVWDYMQSRLPGLERIVVMETRDARCEYEGR
jgi:6-pyruvoyltetrahydropterin/6-carboxytetrahydropterin synthase